jgi:Tol biopolymer transport system component/DNA-binding winged helix-turn-helix (wHTH) protein
MSSNGSRMIRFGVFEVDQRAGELRRNGFRVKLQEQPFQILALLLERPGEVVTREELQGRLWPADTFVDFDHSLNAAVRRLRDALDDSAENPRFVETVARRGYRFLAPIHGSGGAVVAEPPVPPLHPVRRWTIAAAGALVLVGLGVGLFVGKRGSPPLAPTPPIAERRLTANPSEYPISNAALSHDGRYLAFSDPTGFYLRQVETGETHQLVLPQGFKAQPVAWFPDGSHILATSVAGPTERPALWQLSTVGGSPRKLNDQGGEASVSPDGSQIVFLRGSAHSEEMWLMRADGGRPRKITGDVGDLFRSPVWSRDGKRIAYLRAAYSPGTLGVQPQIEILDFTKLDTTKLEITKNERTIVLAQPQLGPAIAWVGDHLAYVLNEAPPSQNDSNIWWTKIDSQTSRPVGTPARLTSSPGSVDYLSVSDDGKRLAYLKQGSQPDVYVARLEANGTRLSPPKRLTLDERQDFPYSWTPDSKQVIFASDRDGAFHIFRQSLDENVPELIVGGNQQWMLPRLTPDGKQIVYLEFPWRYDQAQVNRVLRVSLSGGPPELVLEGRGISNLQCARLPSTLCLYSQIDEKRMTFLSFDPVSGKGHDVAHIDDDIPYSFNWSLSPDGSMLALAKKTDIAVQPEIRLLMLRDHTERILKVAAWSGISSVDWSADGKNLWVRASTTTGTNGLLNVDLQGRVRPVWEQTKMAVGWAIPSPYGRYLALWQADGNANVWMIDNF